MTKDKDKDRLSGDDRRLWDFVTRGIRPLEDRAKIITPPAAQDKKKADPVVRSRLAGWMPSFGLKDAPEKVENSGDAGIDRRTADRLRRGQMEIEARLDLHGMRQGEAQEELVRFLLRAHDSGRRCVLVITGKGQKFGGEQEAGVLRRSLPVWIAQAPLAAIILLHSPARPQDGGEGAFYILLRRKRGQ